MTKPQRQLVKKLWRKFGKSEKHLPLIKRIVLLGDGKLDLMEEYDKMLSWCGTKNKNASLQRFNNWIKRSVGFQANNIGMSDIQREIEETKRKFSD